MLLFRILPVHCQNKILLVIYRADVQNMILWALSSTGLLRQPCWREAKLLDLLGGRSMSSLSPPLPLNSNAAAQEWEVIHGTACSSVSRPVLSQQE